MSDGKQMGLRGFAVLVVLSWLCALCQAGCKSSVALREPDPADQMLVVALGPGVSKDEQEEIVRMSKDNPDLAVLKVAEIGRYAAVGELLNRSGYVKCPEQALSKAVTGCLSPADGSTGVLTAERSVAASPAPMMDIPHSSESTLAKDCVGEVVAGVANRSCLDKVSSSVLKSVWRWRGLEEVAEAIDFLVDCGALSDTNYVVSSVLREELRETELDDRKTALYDKVLQRTQGAYASTLPFYSRIIDQGASGDTRTPRLLTWLIQDRGFKVKTTKEGSISRYLKRESLLFSKQQTLTRDSVFLQVQLILLLEEVHDHAWRQAARWNLINWQPEPQTVLLETWVEAGLTDRGDVVRVIEDYMHLTLPSLRPDTIVAVVNTYIASGNAKALGYLDFKSVLPVVLPELVSSWHIPEGFGEELLEMAKMNGLVNTARLASALGSHPSASDWRAIYSKDSKKIGGHLSWHYLATSLDAGGHSMDWRKHLNEMGCASATMLDQSKCGTCWANAISTVIGMRMCLKTLGAFGMQLSVMSLVEAIKYRADPHLHNRYQNYKRKSPAANLEVSNGVRIIDSKDPMTRRQIVAMDPQLVMSNYKDHGGSSSMVPEWLTGLGGEGLQPLMCNTAKCKTIGDSTTRALGSFMFGSLRHPKLKTSKEAHDSQRKKGVNSAPKVDIDDVRLSQQDRDLHMAKVVLRHFKGHKRLQALRANTGALMPATRDELLEDMVVCDKSSGYGIQIDKRQPNTMNAHGASVHRIEKELNTHGPLVVTLRWDYVLLLLKKAPRVTAHADAGSAVEVTLVDRTRAPNRNEASSSRDASHAVVLIGYQKADPVDYWIFQNSWGTDWHQGQEGYFYLQKGPLKTRPPTLDPGVLTRDFFEAADGVRTIGPNIDGGTLGRWMKLNRKCQLSLGVTSCGDGYCANIAREVQVTGDVEGADYACVCATSPFTAQATTCAR